MTISFVVTLTLPVALLGDTNAPSTCALYFDFTHTQVSEAWFGEANKDGTMKSRANLGSRNDPQGQLTISSDGSSFAFLTHDNSTNHKLFGCCDPVTIMNVEIETGKWAVQSLHRTSAVKGAKCGLFGCGFLDIAPVNPQSKKVVGWVEQLTSQPPPAPSPAATRRAQALPKVRIGQAFVEFDLDTGDATAIRPFGINEKNETGVGTLGGVSARFDDQENMWFPCYPDNDDQNTEGMCKVPATKATTNAPISAMKWSNKKFTITDIQYSTSLQSVIVLAQEINDGTKQSMTNVYQIDSKSMHKEAQDWPLLLSLGNSWSTLHQTTISSDGRYLMVLLQTGNNQDVPIQNMVTVDLVAKKEAGRVVVKDNKDIAILQVIPCQHSSMNPSILV